MGVAARKMAPSAAPARPRLRSVTGGRRRARSRAGVRTAVRFRAGIACLLVLACAGAVRVSLAVQAAEAAVDASALREELKEERLTGRVLEADKSALASPSRIEVLASETLDMREPTEVCYLELPVAGSAESDDAPTAVAASGGSGIVSTLMDLAAGEAQVLLVGDMGLGTAR